MSKSKKHIYIIPQNFQGVIVIFYGQGHGSNTEQDEKGNIIFTIPENGILKTQATFDPVNLKENEFWYSNKVPLAYKEDVNSLNDTTINSFGLHYGKLYKELNGEPITFEMLFIGNKTNINSIAERGENMKLLKLLQE